MVFFTLPATGFIIFGNYTMGFGLAFGALLCGLAVWFLMRRMGAENIVG